MRRLALACLLAYAAAVGACEKKEPQVPVLTAPPSPSSSSSSPSPPGAPESAADTAETRLVARTLKRVSAVRGLAALRPVPGKVLDRAALVAEVRTKADTEYPKAVIEREGKSMELLGFAPPKFDYLGELSRLLEAQLDGFYEPRNGTMYLAADLAGDAADLALAHELVHALQDQHYDLKKHSGYRPGKSDESMATSMLAEGDATSAMLDVMFKSQGKTALDLPEEAFTGLLANAMNFGDAAKSPHLMRSTLIFPYVEGTSFVHALRRKGGWALVDRAWRERPQTTEQVLHPAKWEAHEPALAVPAPSGAALGEGFARIDEDTSGEGGLRLTFEEWVGDERGREAAAGWGGDRSGIFARGDTLADANLVVYDAGPRGAEDANARRAFALLAQGLEKLGKPALKDATTVCIERKELGPLLLGRRGRALVVLAGPAERSAAAVWTPKSTCAKVKRWSAEVLAQGDGVQGDGAR